MSTTHDDLTHKLTEGIYAGKTDRIVKPGQDQKGAPMYFVIIEHTLRSHRVVHADRASTALVAAIAVIGFRVNERTRVRDADTINRIRCAYLKHTDELGEEYFALNNAYENAKAGADISFNFGPASEPATTPY